MTPDQKQTLKTHALANQATVVTPSGAQTIATLMAAPSLASGDAQLIADWYNLTTNPAFYAWQFSRSRMDNRRSILNVTGSANQLDALTGAKRDSLLWAMDDSIDCRLAAVRASIDDLTGSQNTLKAAILDGFKRLLRNVEKAFAVGTGSFAVPADGGFEGTVIGDEISDIHGLS